MTPPPNPSALPTWESLILSERSASAIWTDIFARLSDVALAATSPAALLVHDSCTCG